MPVSTLTCPKCGSVLKPANPVPAGKKIKCPKCTTIFEARDDNGIAAKPRAGAAKKPGAPKKPAKHYDDPDDDGIATYGVVREPSEQVHRGEEDDDHDDEARGEINYVPDLSVKDPRGPAQATLVRPSNFLLATGVFGVLITIGVIGWMVFPFIFTEYQPTPENFFKDKQGLLIEKKWESLTPEEKTKLNNAIDDFILWNWSVVGACIPLLLCSGCISIGAVKMQNMESYRWSMTAAILAVLPLHVIWIPLGLPIGIWALTTLRSEKVRAGFDYVAD